MPSGPRVAVDLGAALAGRPALLDVWPWWVRAVPGRAARAGGVRGARRRRTPSSGWSVQDDRPLRAGAAARTGRHAAVGHRSGRRTTGGARQVPPALPISYVVQVERQRSPGWTHPLRSSRPRTRWRRPSSGSGPVMGDASATRARARVVAPHARRHPRRRRGHADRRGRCRRRAEGRRAPQRRPHPVRPRSRPRPGRAAAHRTGQHPALARGAGVRTPAAGRIPTTATRWRPPCARPRRRRACQRRGGRATGRAARPVHLYPADRLCRRAGDRRTGQTRRPCTRWMPSETATVVQGFRWVGAWPTRAPGSRCAIHPATSGRRSPWPGWSSGVSRGAC